MRQLTRPPFMHDAGTTELVVRWAEVPTAVRYELQFRPVGDADANDEWTTVSAALTSCAARKRGLPSGSGFEWRVRARDAVEWLEWSAASEPMHTLGEDATKPGAPSVRTAGGMDVVMEWPSVPNAERYELQWLDPGADEHWLTTSAKLKGTQVRKKGLVPGHAYEARLRALVDGRWGPFSAPSAPLSVATLADCWPRNMGPVLTNAAGQTIPTQVLAGGIVVLFAAASW